MSHLLRFGGKPAGLFYSTKQEEGAVIPEHTETKSFKLLPTADGGKSERRPTWPPCAGKEERHLV